MLNQATFVFSLDLIPLNSYEQEVHQRALARAEITDGLRANLLRLSMKSISFGYLKNSS